MQSSQSAQNQYLQSLHDQEVRSLMKRIENQTKEDLTNLAKKHKDKNEFARVKRELQQKLIEQAVNERHRFESLLSKRRSELDTKHEEIRTKFTETRTNELLSKCRHYDQLMESLVAQYQDDPELFVATVGRTVPVSPGGAAVGLQKAASLATAPSMSSGSSHSESPSPSSAAIASATTRGSNH